MLLNENGQFFVVERDGKDVKLKVKFNTEDYEGHTYTVMDFWLRGVKKNSCKCYYPNR